MAFLTAYDRNSPFIIPGLEGSSLVQSNLKRIPTYFAQNIILVPNRMLAVCSPQETLTRLIIMSGVLIGSSISPEIIISTVRPLCLVQKN